MFVLARYIFAKRKPVRNEVLTFIVFSCQDLSEMLSLNSKLSILNVQCSILNCDKAASILKNAQSIVVHTLNPMIGTAILLIVGNKKV